MLMGLCIEQFSGLKQESVRETLRFLSQILAFAVPITPVSHSILLGVFT